MRRRTRDVVCLVVERSSTRIKVLNENRELVPADTRRDIYMYMYIYEGGIEFPAEK